MDYYNSPKVIYFCTGNKFIIHIKNILKMKTKSLIVLFALLSGLFNARAIAGTPAENGNYVYHNQNMHVQVTMPYDWQSKLKVTETDQVITFSYANPGSEPVFVYSISKISEQTWMNIKDQMQN